jgi:hypothetical protein
LDKVNVGVETLSEMVVEARCEPEVPVTVTVDEPSVAVLLAVNVMTAVVMKGLGRKDAVTPLGRPEAVSVTLLLNPF